MSVSKTLSIGLIIIVVVLAVIAGFFAYEWYAAENNYHALYAQYVSLQSNYTALEGRYSALQTNYTNLQNQYNSLQSQYSGLQGLYNSLESQYNTLQSEYSSLQSQYSNVSGLLNAVVTGMVSDTETDTVSPGDYDFLISIYVPSGCTASVTFTVSSTGPVTVYVMGAADMIDLLIDEWAQYYGQSPPFTWSYYYEFSGTYIQQTITLSPTYQYGGNMYFVVVYNPNAYSVTATGSITLNHLSCGSSS